MIRNIVWIVSATFGLAVGGFVLHFPGSPSDASTFQPTQAIFGAILGFITGAFVGVVQWAALRLSRRAGARLVGAMGLAVGVTHAVADGAPASLGLLPVAIAAGFGVAVVTGVVLAGGDRPSPPRASPAGWADGSRRPG